MAGRVLALVDGEHYPSVVRDALAGADGVVAALLVGGGEKLDGDPDYGVPLVRAGGDAVAAMLDAARLHAAQTVLDLSDEPVVGEAARLRLAAHALSAGLSYHGPGFRFEPPPRAPVAVPTVEVVGTGKRVGKTAVAGHLARVLEASGRRVALVAMGRGGPAEPELVPAGARPTAAALLARARAGQHAASDFLEDAALTGVATVGARRCGGGLAGEPFSSNVDRAVAIALEQRPDVLIMEGSGSCLPPVAADRRVLVCPAAKPPAELSAGFGPVRVLGADVAVVTGAGAGVGRVAELRAALRAINPGIHPVAVELVPEPVAPVAGRRVAYFTTAPEHVARRLAGELERLHGAEVVATVTSLADRPRLRLELESTAVAAAAAYVVEIKAAAIDVVADAAERRGVEVVFCDNRPRSLPGEDDLDARLLALAPEPSHA